MRRLLTFILPAFTLVVVHGCTATPPPPPPLATPVSSTIVTPPTCGGGPAATPGTMDANEQLLANLINNLRGAAQEPPNPPSAVNVGVAKFHAAEIAASGNMTFVGNDGEDMFRRIVCSGGLANTSTGIIIVGFSGDPHEVFRAIQDDYGAFGVMYNFAFQTNLSVGYSGGYWVIILQ